MIIEIRPIHPPLAEVGCGVLARAVEHNRLFGTREFYVAHDELLALLGHVIGQVPRPTLLLNRIHLDRRLVHRVEFRGLSFICVSEKAVRLA